MIAQPWATIILIALAILSLLLVFTLLRRVPNEAYKLFLKAFYFGALLFFGTVYLRQLNISYEARHFRIIGILITPGMIYLVSNIKIGYRMVFAAITICIAVYSFTYLFKEKFSATKQKAT